MKRLSKMNAFMDDPLVKSWWSLLVTTSLSLCIAKMSWSVFFTHEHNIFDVELSDRTSPALSKIQSAFSSLISTTPVSIELSTIRR
jgi:hypothetical protein